MSSNPYQAPQSDAPGELRPGTEESLAAVKGKFLVVPSGAVLPLRCVRTNLPVTEADMVRKTFYWCSPIWMLAFPFLGILVVLIYFVARKKCVVTYGLHPSERDKFRTKILFKTLGVLGMIAAAISMMVLAPPNGPYLVLGLILILVAICAGLLGNQILSIEDHRKGLFRFKGCSPTFLQADDLPGAIQIVDNA